MKTFARVVVGALVLGALAVVHPSTASADDGVKCGAPKSSGFSCELFFEGSKGVKFNLYYEGAFRGSVRVEPVGVGSAWRMTLCDAPGDLYGPRLRVDPGDGRILEYLAPNNGRCPALKLNKGYHVKRFRAAWGPPRNRTQPNVTQWTVPTRR